MPKDQRLSMQEACEKYRELTPDKLRTLIDKVTIRAEKVKGRWRINGHDLRNLFEGKQVDATLKKTQLILKDEKTKEEIIKIRLQNRDTIESIKDEENQKFLQTLNSIFNNFSNWPQILGLGQDQEEIWNDLMEEVSQNMTKLIQTEKEDYDALQIS
jgi:hypothetical protein